MDYDNPDHRPFWSNTQTNEQQFGILSFDRHKIRINGEISDWKDAEPLYETDGQVIKAIYMDHDERYLYYRIDYDPAATGFPILTIDTVPDQGNDSIVGLEGVTLAEAADFIVDLSEEARVLVDEYYDFFTIQYGLELDMLGREISLPVKNSGNFVPIQFALNKEYFVVDQNVTLPFHAYETGKLKEGNGDPAAADYDSMADYYVDSDKGILELRLPWLLLSARDPSQKEFQGDLITESLEASIQLDEITIGALFVEEDQVVYQMPSQPYTWDNWDMPLTEERLKASYPIIKKTFEQY